MNDITDKVIGILEKIGEATQQAYPVIRQEYVYYTALDSIVQPTRILSIFVGIVLVFSLAIRLVITEGEDVVKMRSHIKWSVIFEIICFLMYVASSVLQLVLAPNYVFIQHLMEKL